MTNNTPEVTEVTENIKKIIELKYSIYTEIYSHENEIKRLKNRLQEIKNKLMELCTHEWTYEHYSGMYDKSDKVCRLCESRIYRF